MMKQVLEMAKILKKSEKFVSQKSGNHAKYLKMNKDRVAFSEHV